MLGSILGDIVGSTYEFANTKDYSFEMFPPGSNFTDDTILTIAIADAILNNKDYGASIREWALKYPNPKGAFGRRFSQWLHSDDHRPYYSFGNGSAMRVSAIGWLFDTEEEVADEARKSAECTHNHPEGIKGAQATAIALFLARKGNEKTFIKSHIQRKFGYQLNRSVEEIRKTYSFDESCQKTVPEALICFLESNSFEDAIRKAISIGGDSDTIGAITGGIAEAYYGIPVDLGNKSINFLPQDMLSILNQFWMRTKNYFIDLNIETKELLDKYAKLKKVYAELFLQRHQMLSHEEPLLTAKYLQKVGHKQYEIFSLSTELSLIKQRISLLQAYINRNEIPDLKKVENAIEFQSSEYREKVEKQAKKLAAANEFLKGSFLSEEEVRQIKSHYYNIVKRLHPDINPDLTEEMKEYFVRAQTAYELSDLSTLQQIVLALENGSLAKQPQPLNNVMEIVKHLALNIQKLKTQIKEIDNNFPFIYRELLNDKIWINEQLSQYEKEITILKQEIKKLKTWKILLEEWKPEL